MTFKYKNLTRRSKLSSATIELFEKVDAFEYPVLQPKYHNFGELHDTLEVEVTDKLNNDRTYILHISIADIKARVKELEKEKSATEKRNSELWERFEQTKDHNLRNQLERQMKGFQGYSELEELEGVLRQNEGKPDDYVVEITGTTSRLGYYTRKGNDAKIVLEYNFGAELISTYIHEMMHAFYDSERLGNTLNSIEYVEEPLAEYGMLKFMAAFVQTYPEHKHLLDDAINIVNEKQYTLGLSHYAFGEFLYQNYSHIEWEKLMLDAKNKVDVNSMEYKSLQAIFQTRPNKNNWDKAAQLLHDILTKANGEPSVKIAKNTRSKTAKRKAASPNDREAPLNIDKATYDSWLKRFQETGILPSIEEMEEAIGSPLMSSAVSKTTGPSKVIVKYQEPYNSFVASYKVHLEYDYSKDELKYLIKDPLRGLSKTLSDDEIRTIKAYLKNRQNIEDFFQQAHDTPPLYLSHVLVHELSIEYGERSKSVENGELMPWAEPFAKLC